MQPLPVTYAVARATVRKTNRAFYAAIARNAKTDELEALLFAREKAARHLESVVHTEIELALLEVCNAR